MFTLRRSQLLTNTNFIGLRDISDLRLSQSLLVLLAWDPKAYHP